MIVRGWWGNPWGFEFPFGIMLKSEASGATWRPFPVHLTEKVGARRLTSWAARARGRRRQGHQDAATPFPAPRLPLHRSGAERPGPGKRVRDVLDMDVGEPLRRNLMDTPSSRRRFPLPTLTIM